MTIISASAAALSFPSLKHLTSSRAALARCRSFPKTRRRKGATEGIINRELKRAIKKEKSNEDEDDRE
jgi:hypothetical protein